MKYALLFGLMLVLITTKVQSSSENSLEKQSSSYLKDLEELGYCVIPQVISTAETEILYNRVWNEFIEKAWPNCKMDDRSNWKEAFPIHNRMGVFSGPAGQIQVMWDLRQDPRIVDIFAKIWSTKDLIVSMDGMSVMCPPEIRDGCINPWPHVDQSSIEKSIISNNPPIGFVSESALTTKPYTIQGQFLFEDSFDGDGGFYCIPKSHLRFDEFAQPLEIINALQIPWSIRSKVRDVFINEFFDDHTDDSYNNNFIKHVTAPRGSIILWDSRTVHWNQHPNKDRPYRKSPKVRMVGYLCYVPKARLEEIGRTRRIIAFENGISTTHNPAYPELKYSNMLPEFRQYIENPNYIKPKISLTKLGESLLGVQ